MYYKSTVPDELFRKYEDLKKMKLENFDNWASIYGETITAVELDVTKSYIQIDETEYQKVA